MILTADHLRAIGFNDPNVIASILANPAEVARYEKELGLTNNLSAKIDTFVKKWTGKYCKWPTGLGGKCMDLWRMGVSEIYGYPQSKAVAGAKNVWDTYLKDYYDRIAYTPGFIPKKGDTVIFGTGTYGHICFFLRGDKKSMITFDANWPTGSRPKEVMHTYSGVLGVLRPKR